MEELKVNAGKTVLVPFTFEEEDSTCSPNNEWNAIKLCQKSQIFRDHHIPKTSLKYSNR